MCAAGSPVLSSNLWFIGPPGDGPELAGTCYATHPACDHAGYRYDGGSEAGEGGSEDGNTEPPDLVDECEPFNNRMSRTLCDAMAGGSFWENTTCQHGQLRLMDFRANPEHLAPYCGSLAYREWFDAAMARCCTGGDSISMDALCGDLTVSPTPPPVSIDTYTRIGGTIEVYTDSACEFPRRRFAVPCQPTS